MKNLIYIIFVISLLFYTKLTAQDAVLRPYGKLLTKDKENITALTFSGDGKLMLSGDDEGNIEGWNLEGKQSFINIKMNKEIVFLNFLPDDFFFIAVDKSGLINIYNITDGKIKKSFKTNSKPVKCSYNYLNNHLAIANDDEEIEIFDLKSEMRSGIIKTRGKTDDLMFLGIKLEGTQILTINKGGEAVIWDPYTLKLVRESKISGGEWEGSQSVIRAAGCNRASDVYCVGIEEAAIPKGGIQQSRDLMRQYSIISYDWNTGFEIKRDKTLWGSKSIVLGPGDDYISVANDENNDIELINLKKSVTVSKVTSEDKIKVLAVSEDNKWLATGSTDGKITLWQLQFSGIAALSGKRVIQEEMEQETGTKDSKQYLSKKIKRWAVVVGISKYQHSGKGIRPLQYADADAKAFYDYLKSPQGGGFSDSTMRLLINEKATYQNIRTAINQFLGQAIEDDLVIIYFAGHGSPDPKNPKNLFLITYDTDPNAMSSTGYLMDDLKEAMNRFIKARNVLIFTDACHSAGVTGQYTERALEDEAIINRYLLKLAESQSSTLIFTASEVNETSKESKLWGNGHGVFTWSLLEGMKGAADVNSDGIVTIGELIDFTQEKVKRETNSQQHPTVSTTKFDRKLPVSVIGGRK